MSDKETAILDRNNPRSTFVYSFIDTPVWFSMTLEVPVATAAKVKKLASDFHTVQAWLDTCWEAARSGAQPPEMPSEVKEILWPESATPPAEKRRKRKDTEAALSNE
jgi:hypothetical protein